MDEEEETTVEETNPLLHHKTNGCAKYLRSCCIPFRGAILVLIWSALLHSSGSYLLTAIMILRIQDKYNTASISEDVINYAIVLGAMMVTLVFYPVVGLLAETKFTRFKFMVGGNVVVILGLLVLMSDYFVDRCLKDSDASECLSHPADNVTVPLVLGLIITHIGLGIFEANAIQFGADQLQFAKSDELSKFVHWYFWTLFVVRYTLTSIIVHLDKKWYTFPLFVMTIFSLFCTITALVVVIFCSCLCQLFIEPTSRTNPLTLINKVMNYASQHTQPVKPSAFTYGDEASPSRLDLGKERFGGPFTTEQVEDVKSFLQIIVLLFTLFGLNLSNDMFLALGKVLSDYSDLDNHTTILSLPVVTSSQTLFYAVIILGIPLYMCLIRPCLCNVLPCSMLKKIGVGLIMTFIALALASGSSFIMYTDYSDNNVTCFSNFSIDVNEPDYHMAITVGLISFAQLFSGAGYGLVFLTTLEFILAQAPRSMQSLLIGLWYSYQSLGIAVHLASILTLKTFQCQYWPYLVKTGFAGISCILFMLACYRFRYRERQEFSNIHYRAIIEEYTSRHLQTEEMVESSQQYIIKSI